MIAALGNKTHFTNQPYSFQDQASSLYRYEGLRTHQVEKNLVPLYFYSDLQHISHMWESHGFNSWCLDISIDLILPTSNRSEYQESSCGRPASKTDNPVGLLLIACSRYVQFSVIEKNGS
jgi:hypothetical protein